MNGDTAAASTLTIPQSQKAEGGSSEPVMRNGQWVMREEDYPKDEGGRAFEPIMGDAVPSFDFRVQGL